MIKRNRGHAFVSVTRYKCMTSIFVGYHIKHKLLIYEKSNDFKMFNKKKIAQRTQKYYNYRINCIFINNKLFKIIYGK